LSTIDIGKIFNAEPKSIFEFLMTDGQGCYVPAYQRPYSWDLDNIKTLLEKATNGIEHLLDSDSTISFLGTIIAIHDIKLKTVNPVYKADVASRVMTIIDGQQRISTLLMMNMIFHNELELFISQFKDNELDSFKWLCDECQVLSASIEKTFLIDRTTGQGCYRYYPRIIRALEDVWSKDSKKAKYNSPIAKLTWDYINHTKSSKPVKQFKYAPIVENEKTSHEPMMFIFSKIQKQIKTICRKDSEEHGFPSILQITKNQRFQESLWKDCLPKEIISYLLEEIDTKHYKQFVRTFRLLILSKYINDRMAFTIVTTESENDAFDMFEALNTTGEPLTAFETFKPKVIEAEGLEEYENSPSHKNIKNVELYLSRFKEADRKQKATGELLIPFALAQSGEKLKSGLNSQRQYLSKEFDRFKDSKPGLEPNTKLDNMRDFTNFLSNLSSFMHHTWNPKTDSSDNALFNPLAINDKEASICIEALKSLNHTIVIAPLVSFYHEAVNSRPPRLQQTQDFVQALKATTAFSMLWRGAKGGTENIDGHYRDIMRTGFISQEIPPLAVSPKDLESIVSVSNYKRALRFLLKTDNEDYNCKEEWIEKAHKTPIYKGSKHVSRFLVFAASDDCICDSQSPGLIKKGRSGIAPLMDSEIWRDNKYFSIEHIAPQNGHGIWEQDIYDDEDLIHTLGNLILLPMIENNLVGKRPWDDKRLLYSALSANDETELGTILDALKTKDLNISAKAEQVLLNSSFLGMCKSVSLYPDLWNKDFINRRSKLIASLAWERIYPWLK